MEDTKNYNIALDIGTNSVGWSVTDDKNNLLSYNKKVLWGARIFDAGETKQTRRTFRSTRRRLDRRRERINLLRQLLKEDIEKVDPYFFIKLDESFKWLEDKTCKPEFESVFKDINYNAKYPTIYHLRNELITKKEKLDIRLVYLAIVHIIKYRGNFLYENLDMNSNNAPEEVISKLNQILNYVKEIKSNEDTELNFDEDIVAEIINILKLQEKSAIKKEKLKDILGVNLKENKDKKIALEQLCNAFIGYNSNISKLFGKEQELKIDFSAELDEDKILEVLTGEEYEIVLDIKAIYDFNVLQKIMKNKSNISEVFKEKFDNYHEDLEFLKYLYRNHAKDKYFDMFRNSNKKTNYYNYNGKNFDKKLPKRTGTKCSLEELYKTINKDLMYNDKEKQFDQLIDTTGSYYSDIDLDKLNRMINRMEEKAFLEKLNTTDNGAIPYQVHRSELEKILENQSNFYNTIKEEKEKIISIMNFRVPYYIGPLNAASKEFAWIVRDDTKIYPWNFEDVVNIEESAEKFIERMTSFCTYLPKEKVVAKQSLLYSKYCVLNELNNISINNKKIDYKLKQLAFNELFKKKKRVTKKEFEKFIKDNNYVLKIENTSGYQNENGFASSLTSYNDMAKIFGEDFVEKNQDKIEDVIKAITLFTERKILKQRIQKILPNLEEEKLNKLQKLKYSGWGKLSKKLLLGLKSKSDNKTIMDKLWDADFNSEEKVIHNMNFMQIINESSFGFKEQIEKEEKESLKSSFSYDDVEDIPCSPAVKRSLWQTIQVVKEIKKVMKCEPTNIFIEFTREDGEKGKTTDNRIKMLKKLYETLNREVLAGYNENVLSDLNKQDEKQTLTDMLYLYYLQNGKCLYSGKTLTISELTQTCEIDHIIPRSYIKDDSFSNRALVLRPENQKKSNGQIPEETINKQFAWWKQLYDCGLMDAKKFKNLTRTQDFRESDKEKFIARQLVETSQTVKYVANILNNVYKNIKVYAIRAKMSSDFRKKYDIIKCRSVNNFHHAHDAYIASIIGNHAVQNGLTQFEYGLKNEAEMKKKINQYLNKNDEIAENSMKSGKKYSDLYGVILNVMDKDESVNIDKIKKAILKNELVNADGEVLKAIPLVTKKVEELTGEFYNQTLYGRNVVNSSKNTYLPVKKELDAKKYGGYTSVNKAYYSMISFVNKKGEMEIKLVGIPIYIEKLVQDKKQTILYYFEQSGYENVKILKNKICKYQRFMDDKGNLLELTSDKYYGSCKELIFDYNIVETLRDIEKKIYLKCTEEEKENFGIKLNNVYDIFIKKIEQEVKEYKREADELKAAKGSFEKLNLEDKSKVILNIMEVTKGTYKDLSKLQNGSKTLSKVFGMRNYFKLSEDLTFIDESVTGIYVKRYKVKDLIK
ncbi:MAG: type II CRISPR RNA-guided endonuclease Cas9 [Lachnospiraceae bacterium]|jgi:CRISPR-associated endonuclease Csn1|nr:type II CRISPR RNA-guided endonuclease Cas9 [Lachnospiraceae bacterium]